LSQVLRDLPQLNDERVLVGSATSDDAGVYQLNDDTAMVQTLDFFTPIVDDPYLFGKIAATNSLSDVYAMGGRPITAMAIAGMPSELPVEMIREIFRGGAEVAKEAGTSLVGGHTIKNPEPIYGLSVTGLVHPDGILANSYAKEGDVLLLTKPLGTGIVSQAIKTGKCSRELENKAVEVMTSLNRVGARLGEEKLARACTDVTGFGFLGHLMEMAEGAGLTAKVDSRSVPALDDSILDLIDDGLVPGGSRKNLSSVAERVRFSDEVSESMKLLLADAQTAGGLLLSIPPDKLDEAVTVLKEEGALCVAQVGEFMTQDDHAIEVG